MYFECGDHVDTRQVFDEMPVRNLHSWNNAGCEYTKLGMLDATERLFDKMERCCFMKQYSHWMCARWRLCRGSEVF